MTNFFEEEPIDIVYTWVDDSDKTWQEKKNLALNKYQQRLTRESIDGRFENHNELLYSLRSVDLYMPWVRKIFIVTDNQIPDWLDISNPKIKIIDHKDIFSDLVKVPVFNSLLIEFFLHKIPGLSEKFIYFNDDFLINKPLEKGDFFSSEGTPVVYCYPTVEEENQVLFPVESAFLGDKGSVRSLYDFFNERDLPHYFSKNSMDIIQLETSSFKNYFWLKHAPYAFSKKYLEYVCKKYELFINLIGLNQFRSRTDIWLASLVAFNRRKDKQGIFSEENNDLFEFTFGYRGQKICSIVEVWNFNYKFICMAQFESSEKKFISICEHVLNLRFNIPSQFEKKEYMSARKVELNNVLALVDEIKSIDNASELNEKEFFIKYHYTLERDYVVKVKNTENQYIRGQVGLIKEAFYSSKSAANLANGQLILKTVELSEIQKSKGWRLVLFLRKIFNYIFPESSFRRKIIIYSLKFTSRIIGFFLEVKKKKSSFDRLFKKAFLVFRMNGIKVAIIRSAQYILNKKPFNKAGEIEPEIYKIDYIDSLNIRLLKEINFDFNNKPIVSIIIPVYNKWKYTYNCLDSLAKNINDVSFEVIVVDDGSTDETNLMVKKIRNLVYVKNVNNLGFVGSCNNGALKAKGEYVVFLNNDTSVKMNWLSALVNTFKDNKNIGLVGSKLIYPDGRLQEAGGIIWKNKNAWNYGRYQNPNNPEFNYLKDVDYCSGASIILPKKVFEQLEGFDSIFSPGYCEDSDLAFRVRKLGYRTVYQPKSELFHFEGVTSGNDLKNGMKKYQVINNEKFFERWHDVLEKENCCDHTDGPFLARDRSKNKKTVLVIDHYAPTFDKDAGSRTVYQYIKLLCELGYNVKFIGDNFNYDEKYVIALEQLGVEVLFGQYYYENWEKWIRDNSKYINFAFVNRPHISGKYIDILKKYTEAKIIYYGHDLHFLRIKREYELTKNKDLLKESGVWKEIELGIMRRADISLYPSSIEVDKINKIDPKIKVGVLTAYMYDNRVFPYNAKETKDLLFIGGFNHKPNIDAVLWFCKDIFPDVLAKNPGIKLYIVGSNPTKEIMDLNSDSVIVKGFLSDADLDDLYGEVRLMVAPLRYGAGIKGKIIESLYHCLPVVTTDCGAEGINNKQKMLVVANDNKKMIKEINFIYSKFDALNSMSLKGKKFVNENYSIDSAAKKIKELF